MAEQEKYGALTSAVMDIPKINPVELDQDRLTELHQSLQQAQEALQHRYDKPNWFAIAGAMLKPQLGGFGASLGSAAEVMGEQVERQRAQQPLLAEMKIRTAQAQLLMEQNKKQADMWEEAKQKYQGQPPVTELERIIRVNPGSATSQAIKSGMEMAGQALTMKREATAAMGRDPMQDLGEFAKVQMTPGADPEEIGKKQKEFDATLSMAKPPQIDQAQWDSMSRYERMDEASRYAQAQREAGMSQEAVYQQQATQAPSKMALLGSIRKLAMGEGIPDAEKDGKTITGQQQMAKLLNYFGGDNPMEVLARAAADGKLSDKLADIDKYARQNNMTPQTRDQFQKLAKLLAESQVAFRNSSLNPTDAFSQLQQTASPNIGNTQSALTSLVDLLAHSEKNAIDKYKYVVNKQIPYRMLGFDPGFMQSQQQYAQEHQAIALSSPTRDLPSWYNLSGTSETHGAPKTRSNERTFNGKTYVRQPDNSWKLKE